MFKILMITTIFIMAVGCKSDPKFNASDEATAKASVETMVKGFSKEKTEKFQSAIMLLAMSGMSMQDVMGGNTSGIEKNIYSKLNGKTADEIIAQAKIIQDKVAAEQKLNDAKREAEAKKQAISEIKDLQAKKVLSEKGKLQAQKIKVQKSRYYIQKNAYGLGGPRIYIKVKNETKESLSRLFFKATLSSPNRKVPWFREDFNYEIAGGIEPGETKEATLTVNKYMGDWTDTVPKGSVFTVEVVGARDHTKKDLFGENTFSNKDEERLAELVKRYGRSTASGN